MNNPGLLPLPLRLPLSHIKILHTGHRVRTGTPTPAGPTRVAESVGLQWRNNNFSQRSFTTIARGFTRKTRTRKQCRDDPLLGCGRLFASTTRQQRAALRR